MSKNYLLNNKNLVNNLKLFYMSKAYCGYSTKLPKGSRFGTLEECYKKRQLRRYGLMAVDQHELLRIMEQSAKKLPKKAIVSAIQEVKSLLPPTTKPKEKMYFLNKSLEWKKMLVAMNFYEKDKYVKLVNKLIGLLEKKNSMTRKEEIMLNRGKLILKNIEEGKQRLFTEKEAREGDRRLGKFEKAS